jgi:hypothetical protein
MATYNPNPRGQLFQPSTNTSLNYYIFVVDIPTSWGVPQYGASKLAGGVLTCTVTNIAFPVTDSPNGVGNNFATYLLPVWTEQFVPITSVIVEGNTPGRVKKTGQIVNTAPIIKFEEPTAAQASGVVASARPFVIKNASDQTQFFFIGAFAMTPAGENYAVDASISENPNDSTELIFKLRHLPGNGQVQAFGCIPVPAPSLTQKAYKKITVEDKDGNKSSSVDLQTKYNAVSYDGPLINV